MALLDHLVYVTSDLATTRQRLSEEWGVDLSTGGSHDGMGTANALFSFGNGTYFELIGPDPSQPTPPSLFDISEDTSPHLATFGLGVGDIDSAVAAMRRLGHDPGDPEPMQRTLPNGDVLHWDLTVPTAIRESGTVPFLIAWGDTPHPSTTLPVAASLVSFRVHHPEPGHLAALYGAIGFDRSVITGPAGVEAEIETPNGVFRI